MVWSAYSDRSRLPFVATEHRSRSASKRVEKLPGHCCDRLVRSWNFLGKSRFRAHFSSGKCSAVHYRRRQFSLFRPLPKVLQQRVNNSSRETRASGCEVLIVLGTALRQLDILVYAGRARRNHLDSFFVEVECWVHNFHDHVINL